MAVSSTAKSDILIAGAGLLGRLVAWRLLRAGHCVTLFDRDTPDAEQSAAKVAAAMLAPYSEVVTCEREIFDWGLQAMAQWPQWLDELEADSGESVNAQFNGSLVVAHTRDAALLDHFNQLLRARVGPQVGERDAVRYLDAAAVAELEPELEKNFARGTYLNGEGCLDNWSLLQALHRAILNLGGKWFSGAFIDRVRPGALNVNGAWHEAAQVIDCRGTGAKPDDSSLRGVRGEVLWVKATDVRLNRPVRLMHPRYQLYISPRSDQIYVIGATEIESESTAPITVRSSLELQSALYSLHRGFGEAHILKAYAQCRPAYPDNLPRIQQSPGLLRLNGLYRHGYLLSPLLVNLALDCLQGSVAHPIVHATGNETRRLAL